MRLPLRLKSFGYGVFFSSLVCHSIVLLLFMQIIKVPFGFPQTSCFMSALNMCLVSDSHYRNCSKIVVMFAFLSASVSWTICDMVNLFILKKIWWNVSYSIKIGVCPNQVSIIISVNSSEQNGGKSESKSTEDICSLLLKD